MIIVPNFKLKYNEEKGFYSIVSLTPCKCPLCGGVVYHRDHKARTSKKSSGEIWHFMLRRLLCEDCAKLHTEIPGIIQPYKHYDSETIQNVIDGGEKAVDCIADESTIYRWKSDFAKAETDINQRVASVYAQETGNKAPLLLSATMLAYIRAIKKDWLAFVIVLLINSGHKLRTRFAFCPSRIDGIVSSTIKKGGKLYDKTIKDSG